MMTSPKIKITASLAVNYVAGKHLATIVVESKAAYKAPPLKMSLSMLKSCPYTYLKII